MHLKIPLFITSLIICCSVQAGDYQTPAHYIQTHATQANITPSLALKKLQEGNLRFMNNEMRQRDFALQTKMTAKKGQAPFAVVLSCMDSRGSPEILFDQGIGDIFSIRIAGNVISDDVLGSLEFATEITGSKLILVMGHTQCGAIDAACNHIKFGQLTPLLEKISPAVDRVKGDTCTPERVHAIARQNVIDMMKLIPQQSTLIAALLSSQKILIVGAMHDLATGKITFFDLNNHTLE